MSRAFCLVCGHKDNEVEKMHYFPAILSKSKIWQERMCMKYSGDTLRNYRICSRHFTKESYVNTVTHRLSRNAVPTLFPCSAPAELSQVETTGPNIDDREFAGLLDATTNTDPEPSTSQSIPQKRSVFKELEIISGKNCSPRKKKLMKVISHKEDYIRKLKTLCRKRAHDIKALADLSNTDLINNIWKDMPINPINFLISQLRCAKRSPKGRRWTTEEKIVALALFKRSPKCYNLLRKLVAMPTKRTLVIMLERVIFDVGINEHIFCHIKENLPNQSDRSCVLLFDEIDIKEHLQYDFAKDKIFGFEDFGAGKVSHKFANRALVFMCQGLKKNWKQPVAYYLTNNGCSSEDLVQCITEVIHAAKHLASLDIVATVCDMGVNNVKALKDMKASVESPFIQYEGDKIYTVFDPPHLLKCTVALFRKHNVELPVSVGEQEKIMTAKFSDIVNAYEIDKNTPLVFRAMFKIRETCLAPVLKFAMQVNIAAQLMSRTVAAFLYTLLSRGELEQRVLATATFVQQVDELFDSFNGSAITPPTGKELKCIVTERSPHINYWMKAFKMVKSWNFRRITKLGNLRTGKPPSQTGWMISLRAIAGIWNRLKTNGLSSLRPRSLNQDSLENLFGAIRSGCGCNDNPTTNQFIASLKTQTLNGLTNQALSGTNCEEDGNVLLSNLTSFITFDQTSGLSEEDGVAKHEKAQAAFGNKSNKIAKTIAAAVSVGKTEILSVAYVGGFILKHIMKEINCSTCQQLLSSPPDDPHNVFISYKEFSDKQKKLMYPSENLVVVVGHAVTQLENILPQLNDYCEVRKTCTECITQNIDFSWLQCSLHKEMVTQSIIKGVCYVGIPWWCKRMNNIQQVLRKDFRSSKRKLEKMKHL